MLGGFPSGQYNGQSTLGRKQWAPPAVEWGTIIFVPDGKPPKSASFSYERVGFIAVGRLAYATAT